MARVSVRRGAGWVAALLCGLAGVARAQPTGSDPGPDLGAGGGAGGGAVAGATGPGLEVYAEMGVAPGNVTVTPDGRVIASLHQFFAPEDRVVEVTPSGEVRPFPSAEWSRGKLDSVLGLRSDPRGVVWMLDNGMRSGATPKLVGWDTRGNELHRVVYLPPPISVAGSFLNDLAVDATHAFVYIADPAQGADAALVVVDLLTGEARRVLQGHRSVVPEDVELRVDGRPVTLRAPDGTERPARVGVNPIALDAGDEWLYFGPMHARTLYRVRTSDLRDASMPDAELARRVEPYADRPVSDGISIDEGGNIYISDVGAGAVGVVGPDKRYRLLAQDPRLSWPDAFSYGPDGKIYVAVNQLHKTPALNGGRAEARPPFLILRFRALERGVIGR